MKQLPEKLISSLEGLPGFNRGSFERVHESGEQVTSIRINPWRAGNGKRQTADGKQQKESSNNDETSVHESLFTIDDSRLLTPDSRHLTNRSRFTIDAPVPWSQFGFYLKERPSFTFDPLFHSGCYYVQEASSMFLEQALKQLVDLSQPIKVLDLCAAPGGKSTHIQSLISPDSLLVSNEVIKTRSNILIDNIIKWGATNTIVTSNDPASFKKLGGYFDVIVVDAPCSGSGLIRRDEEAIEEWSPANVQLCSQRQQRILADALPSLKQNGIMVYSTCSYSKEEDEDICDWLVEAMGMENILLKTESQWNVIESHSSKSNSKSYRFYPDHLKGEGFFLSCFRKKEAAGTSKQRPIKPEKASSKEKQIIQPWLKNDDWELVREEDLFYAVPSMLLNEYPLLKSILQIRYMGTGIGQIMKDRLVPGHSFALSPVLSNEISFTGLSYDDAIRYLQRQDLSVNIPGKGWQLVRYEGFNLGWVNVLSNRINNYYPKELRILKQH
jgi:NOL1/NOP2/sun family putative RNA methylase